MLQDKSGMFRAVGAVLIIWYLSSVFTESFSALDGAMSASFRAVEAAAITSREHLER